MKRLMFIIVTLLLVSTSFGQPSNGLLSYINYRPAFEFGDASFSYDKAFKYVLTPEKLKARIDNSDTTKNYKSFMKYLDEKAYSFIANEKFYMLSYDTCNSCYKPEWKNNMRITRGLYLFRLDNTGWVRACYEPVQIDYKEIQNSIWAHKCYFPWKIPADYSGKFQSGATKGSVNISANGEVTIVLINHEQADESKGSPIFTNITVVLTPTDNNTYFIKR